MSYLDIAALDRQENEGGKNPFNFVSSVNRSLQVHQTSFELSTGDSFYGPSHGQLLIVGESIGNKLTAQHIATTAVDTVARQLLRDDNWLIGLVNGKQEKIAEELTSALQTASERVCSNGSSDTRKVAEQIAENNDQSQYGEPEVVMTVAFIAWPMLVLAHVGDGAAVLSNEEQMNHLVKPHTAALEMQEAGQISAAGTAGILSKTVANSLGGTEKPSVEIWTGEITKEDTLILSTCGLREQVLDPSEPNNRPRSSENAQAYASRLMNQLPQASNEAIVVAKWSLDDTPYQVSELVEKEHHHNSGNKSEVKVREASLAKQDQTLAKELS